MLNKNLVLQPLSQPDEKEELMHVCNHCGVKFNETHTCVSG